MLRKRKGVIGFLVAIVFLASMSGCSLLPGTQDEQARIGVGAIQTALPILKTAGDAYFTAQPQYAAAWQVAQPVFKSLNEYLATLEAQGASGQAISLATIMNTAQPQILQIVNAIAQGGAITPGSGGQMSPQQIALLVMTGIAQGSFLMEQASAWFSGNIPTWQALQAQNAIFEAQLTGGVQKIKRLR